MGVKQYFQFMRGSSTYSGLGAYKALTEVEKGLTGKPSPPKTKHWRKEIQALWDRLCNRYGRGSIGDLSVVKTRNPKKHGVFMGKKPKKKKQLFVRREPVPAGLAGLAAARDVRPPTWAAPRPAPAGEVRVADMLELQRQRQEAERLDRERAVRDAMAAMEAWNQPLNWGGAQQVNNQVAAAGQVAANQAPLGDWVNLIDPRRQ
jgi:hypothetical protein